MTHQDAWIAVYAIYRVAFVGHPDARITTRTTYAGIHLDIDDGRFTAKTMVAWHVVVGTTQWPSGLRFLREQAAQDAELFTRVRERALARDSSAGRVQRYSTISTIRADRARFPQGGTP